MQDVIAIAVGRDCGLEVDGPVQRGPRQWLSQHHSLVSRLTLRFQDRCCHESSARVHVSNGQAGDFERLRINAGGFVV